MTLFRFKVTLEHVYWVRDCIDDRQVTEVLGIEVGCEHKEYEREDMRENMRRGVYACVCKEEGCNKKMNEISTTILKSITTPKGSHSSLMIIFLSLSFI